MTNSFLPMYHKGSITAHHLAIQSLHMVDPSNPGLLLSDLPDAILDRIMEYARTYQPGQMVSNYGGSPKAEQVRAAKRWIENLTTVKAGQIESSQSLLGS